MASNKRRRIEPSAAAPALPDEMVTEVLLRLPVKSILRFGAVCRSWAATLSSEEFRSLHMAKVETGPASPSLFFISPAPGFDSTEVYSCSPSGDSSLLFTLDDVRGDFGDMSPAPCRGLTLLYDAVAPAYYVFNAATRAVTQLPRYQDSMRATAGLGFDARTNEYKVVRLFHGGYYDNQKIKCKVYILGGEHGDRWRPAAGGVPFRFCRFASAAISTARRSKLQPVFADGFLHWLIDPANDLVAVPRAAILSFSVADETFTWVRSPSPSFHLSEVHLVELDGHLCMVRDLRPYGSRLDIWKMKDHSSTSDWSLEHSIDLLQHVVGRGLIEPHAVIRVVGSVGSCRSRKKLILATSQRKVIIHDPVSGTLETIMATGEIRSFYETEQSAPRISQLKESLAPVHKTNEEIALSSPMAKASREILLRLPGDYVVQCKLVSKQWLRLIESQSFVRSYYVLKKNMNRRPKIMLVGKGAGGLGFSFAPLEKLLGQAPRHDACLDTKVVCSKPCHGMNLVSTGLEDYLCNPFTGYRCVYRGRIGSFNVPGQVLSMMGSNDCTQEDHAFAIGNRNVGLGIDPLTQEHVIVQHFYHLKDFKSRQYFLTFSLVCCNIGSPENHLEPPLPLNSMPPTYLAGVMYWMSDPRLGRSSERAIVSFNIATRMFAVIPCPPCISKWNNTSSPCQTFVVEIEGIPCVVLADPIAEELDIWKLQHDRWDRAYKLHLKGWFGYSLRENVVVPLAVDPKDGRFLLNTGRKLGLYDLTKRSIENLYPLDEEKHRCPRGMQHLEGKNNLDNRILPFVPILYEESLASYPRARKARWLRE
ncbi:unnamed protein product [Alopecurus aequalis]